jgi:hypothetical protein
VIGLNSAWLSGSDDALGKLIIGERQIREALDKTKNPDFLLALVHHPLSWLAEFDASDARELLNSRCDFLLHGHVHSIGVVNIVSPGSETFYLAAGVGVECPSYNIVSLDVRHGRALVALRSYSAWRQSWGPDRNMYPSAPDGVLSLVLPERLSHQTQPANLTALNERLSALVSESPQSTSPTAPIPSVPRPPRTLVKEIQEGRCIVFAGAGASADAKLPSWSELLKGMTEQAFDSGVVSDEELRELKLLLDTSEHMVVAAFCRDKLGLFEFGQYLRERLSDSNRVSRTHRILSEIPFRAAVTTNFDSFIEHSRPGAHVVIPEMMERMGAAGVESLFSNRSLFPVIKMHGTEIDFTSIVLTRGDFRNILFAKPKYREFIRRLFTDSTVFFCGYSFRDPNVDFLLQELMASYAGNSRPHYALIRNPGAIATRYWFEDFNIRVIPYELWEGSHVVATAFLQELAAQCSL